MIIRQMPLGPIQANCFILGCEETRQAVVIDPGDDCDRILTSLSGDRLTVTHIIDTHGHFDHIGAAAAVQEVHDLPLRCHADDLPFIENLQQKRYTVGELAELCDIRPNVASEHLRLMEHCGLLRKEREGRKVFYQPAHGCLDRIMCCVRGQFAD